MSGPRLQRVAPVLPLRDPAAAAEFLSDLGFAVIFRAADGSPILVEREDVRLMLVRLPDDAAGWPPKARQCAAYVWVEGVDALWHAWEPVLAAQPGGAGQGPSDRPHGMRELHLIHQSLQLVFGEPCAGPTAG